MSATFKGLTLDRAVAIIDALQPRSERPSDGFDPASLPKDLRSCESLSPVQGTTSRLTFAMRPRSRLTILASRVSSSERQPPATPRTISKPWCRPSLHPTARSRSTRSAPLRTATPERHDSRSCACCGLTAARSKWTADSASMTWLRCDESPAVPGCSTLAKPKDCARKSTRKSGFSQCGRRQLSMDSFSNYVERRNRSRRVCASVSRVRSARNCKGVLVRQSERSSSGASGSCSRHKWTRRGSMSPAKAPMRTKSKFVAGISRCSLLGLTQPKSVFPAAHQSFARQVDDRRSTGFARSRHSSKRWCVHTTF